MSKILHCNICNIFLLFYVYLLIYLKYVIGHPFNLMCRDISFRYMSMVCQLNIYRTINSGSPAGEDQQIVRMLDSRYYIAGAAGYIMCVHPHDLRPFCTLLSDH